MTKSSHDGTVRTFATLRVMGDRLDPEEITRVLKINPTTAYAKGQRYVAGKQAGALKGRTGLWLFSTDRGIKSDSLQDHAWVLLYLLFPTVFEHELRGLRLRGKTTQRIPGLFDIINQESKIRYLRTLLSEKELAASASFFWHGREGAKPPSVPRVIQVLFRQIPISIEADFATDSDMEPVSVPA